MRFIAARWCRVLQAGGLVLIVMLSASFDRELSLQAGVPLDAALALRDLERADVNWESSVEIESGENSAADHTPYYSRISVDGDVWLLHQKAARGLRWRRFGIIVRHGNAYLAKLDGQPTLLGAQCAACHVNGPRALRGIIRAGSESRLIAINALVRNIGVVHPYYPPFEPAPASHTKLLNLSPCSSCHNGQDREWLTGEHRRTIAFQLQHRFMPPGDMTEEARDELLHWLDSQKDLAALS